MRIISGIAKGKKIFNPIDKKTRPLKDMVKESIFNILIHSNILKCEISKCILLDLFSGVGSFGLEAISRGIKKVVFFENYKISADLLKKNLSNLNFGKKAEVYKNDVYEENSLRYLKYKFDIVFMDPPFTDDNINLLIRNLIKAEILSPKNLIIIHRKKTTKDDFDKSFKIIRKQYQNSSGRT